MRTARQRWLLVATAAGSALVMLLSAGLAILLGALNGTIAPESAGMPSALPTAHARPGVHPRKDLGGLSVRGY